MLLLKTGAARTSETQKRSVTYWLISLRQFWLGPRPTVILTMSHIFQDPGHDQPISLSVTKSGLRVQTLTWNEESEAGRLAVVDVGGCYCSAQRICTLQYWYNLEPSSSIVSLWAWLKPTFTDPCLGRRLHPSGELRWCPEQNHGSKQKSGVEGKVKRLQVL